MAKASKPVNLISKHLTKKEKMDREDQEKRLKGRDTLVYEAPKFLSKKEKEIYEFLTEELRESGILNNLDITILLTTVDSIIKMQECRDIINEHGVVVSKKDGDLIRNPATLIYKDYNAIYNKCCMELGLSPSSRSKLSLINVNAQKNSEDPLLQALKGGGNN